MHIIKLHISLSVFWLDVLNMRPNVVCIIGEIIISNAVHLQNTVHILFIYIYKSMTDIRPMTQYALLTIEMHMDT